MSISNFQEKFLHGGCAKFIIGFMAVTFVGSLLYLGQSRGKPEGAEAKGAGDVAATVGSVQITSTAIDQLVQTKLQQQLSRMSAPGQEVTNLPPQYQASVAAAALSDMVQEAAGVYLARQNGADLGDDSVKKLLQGALDQQIQMLQAQLVSQGKLKPNATPKEVDAVFQKEYKQTPSQVREAQAGQIDTALKDPTKHEAVISAAAQAFLMDFYKKKAAVSDADLDTSNNSYEVKQILFRDEPGKSAAQQAGTVLADIRANKIPFEQAVDRYSKDMPPAGKRLSDTTTTISGAQIVGSPDYAPLKGLKVGDVSNVLTLPEGARIFKIVKVTSVAPKDFEKNRAMFRDRLASQQAGQLLSADLKKALTSSLVQWKYPGYEALFLYGQSLSDPTLMTDMAKRSQTMQTVLDKAKNAMSSGKSDARMAALAEFAAFSAIYEEPGADKAKLRDERIRVIGDYLQNNEDSQLRLELVDLYKEKKDADEASANLLSAAQGNNNFDASGQTLFHTIGKKVDELKAANLLPKGSEEQIMKELDRWRRDKADHEKDLADTKRMEEEEHKRAEADQKALDQKDKAPAPKKK